MPCLRPIRSPEKAILLCKAVGPSHALQRSCHTPAVPFDVLLHPENKVVPWPSRVTFTPPLSSHIWGHCAIHSSPSVLFIPRSKVSIYIPIVLLSFTLSCSGNQRGKRSLCWSRTWLFPSQSDWGDLLAMAVVMMFAGGLDLPNQRPRGSGTQPTFSGSSHHHTH